MPRVPIDFPGFQSPNYTQVPDEVFDHLMPHLSEAELKVLLYVVRRTFGFKKTSDAISISQMAEGITTRNGKTLDQGTGLSRSSVKNATANLVKAGILSVEKRQSEEGEYETNVYSLRFIEAVAGVGQNLAYPGSESGPLVGQNLAIQETVRQETVGQDLEDSNGSHPQNVDKYDADRNVLLNYVEDFAREFADTAPLASSVSRAQNLYRQSGLTLESFTQLMYTARAITKERSASVKTSVGPMGKKPRMQYWFACLERLVTGSRG